MSNQRVQEKDFEEFTMQSSDKKTQLHQCLWGAHIKNPQGIVQICHGMAEHMGRYDEFAHYLNDAGFIVCGQDQVGHGDSVNNKDERGHLPLKKGKTIFVEDTHILRNAMQERFGADMPYFIFGHSMGSFIVRSYASYYGEGLAGAIVCATAHQPLLVSKMGNKLARAIAAVKGEHYASKMIHAMGLGGYNKKLDNPKTSLDWLSYNEENVRAYIDDEECGFIFTVGGYDAVTSLTYEIATKECNERIPKDLPMLFIAGDGDPVGGFGKGFEKAVQLVRDVGVEDVTAKLYKHMRHELLKEDDKFTVMEDIATWMCKHCEYN